MAITPREHQSAKVALVRDEGMGVRSVAAGVLVGAILAGAQAVAATYSTSIAEPILLQLDGHTRPDLRADLLALEIEETPQHLTVSVRVLNYRVAQGGTTPVLYYSEGTTAVAIGALLRITLDGSWYECPVTQLDADFSASQLPELSVICRIDRLAPRGSPQEPVLSVPLAEFSASVTATPAGPRVIGKGSLGSGWGALRVNRMTSIDGAGSLSGIYRMDRVEHRFDLTQGQTTSYQATRVRP